MQACPNFSSFEAVGGNGRYSGRVSLRSWQAGETYTLRWPPGGCVLSDSMRSDKYSKLLAISTSEALFRLGDASSRHSFTFAGLSSSCAALTPVVTCGRSGGSGSTDYLKL